MDVLPERPALIPNKLVYTVKSISRTTLQVSFFVIIGYSLGEIGKYA
jgi:hypothetical protein